MDNKKVVIEQELEKGIEAISQLRSLLFQSPYPKESYYSPPQREKETSLLYNESVVVSLENYSTTILNSFDTSISILKKIAKSTDIQGSSVLRSTDGCPPKNRLKTIDTPNLTPDGYTWRKYGQKSILNTKHPREYYRCAYKEDQKCQATKHIQKISDNPTKYRITYYANHTCQPLLNQSNGPNINIFDSPEKDFTNYISFESPHPKQALNSFAFNPLTSSTSSLKSKADFSPPKTLDMAVIVQPSLADDIVCRNHEPEIVFSPRMLMSPNYMELEKDFSLMDGDCFDMSDALQSLWE